MHGFTRDRNVVSALPDIYETENGPPLETMYKAMVLTSCIRSYPCKCSYNPPSSGHTHPLPGVLFTCRESRDATLGKYSIYLEREYDTRGIAVHETSMISFPPDDVPRKKTRRGVRLIPLWIQSSFASTSLVGKEWWIYIILQLLLLIKYRVLGKW